jgi:protein CMS1
MHSNEYFLQKKERKLSFQSFSQYNMEEREGHGDIFLHRAQREREGKRIRKKDYGDKHDYAEKTMVRMSEQKSGRKRIQREGDGEEIHGHRIKKMMKRVNPEEEEKAPQLRIEEEEGGEREEKEKGKGEEEGAVEKKKKKKKKKKKSKKEETGGDGMKIFFEEYETAEKQSDAFSALSVAYPLKEAKDTRSPLDPQCMSLQIELPKTDVGIGDWLKEYNFHLSSNGTLQNILKKRKRGQGGFKRGTPMMVVVSQAAQRACDVIRELRNALPLHAQREFPIAKLFAKHMKIEQQVDFLRTKKCVIAVGTPERIRQMCDGGQLSLSACELLLIDVMPNTKTFNLMTSHDTAHSFFTLFRSHFYERVCDKKTKMAFFA